jgi:hypothetical protein
MHTHTPTCCWLLDDARWSCESFDQVDTGPDHSPDAGTVTTQPPTRSALMTNSGTERSLH